MRNLKKFLALVMAMVMAFSLMLTVNAADQVKDWTDKDQVTEEFTKAVDVLSGMEIFQGDDTGTLRPGDTISRAEVAALIYRAATGDTGDTRAEMYRTYAPFTDVKPDDWFAGYVGYCWNAGYIKGTTATTFNPYEKVTGYEVLAMILRAVGYDKNHEFEGGQWIVNVASIANDKKVTKDVKTTIYGDTLHTAARRDVVASLLFNAIQIDTVTYTPALGYETDRLNGSNKSLGEIWFNLKHVDGGVIVGNQDTGESKTIVNKAKDKMPDHYSYFYNTKNWDEDLKADDGKAAKVETADSYKIDAKTGIDMFGHKVEVYFNEVSGKTFALYDNAKKTALVTAPSSILSASADPSTATLGQAALDAGFKVDKTSSKAVFNQSFGVSGAKADLADTDDSTTDYSAAGNTAKDAGVVAAITTNAESLSALGKDGTAKGYPLYLLISNNDSLTVDMVVAINVNVSKITQVNDYTKFPSVTVAQFTAAPNNAPGTARNDKWNDKTASMIEQKALTATSDKGLNDNVVGVAIVGTNGGFIPSPNATGSDDAPFGQATSTANLWYRLSKPTQTIEGTVTNYANNGDHTGHVIIDGKKVERSLLADAITGYHFDDDSSVKPGTTYHTTRGIDSSKNVGLSPDAGNYGKYRLYLDSEGKYIWAQPIVSSEFIYGTYIDYSTPYGSSSYEYTMIGVDMEGKQVKRVVTSQNTNPIDAARYGEAVTVIDNDALCIPFRDNAGGASTGGVTKNAYRGFNIAESGALTSDATAGGTLPGSNVTRGDALFAAGATITKDAAKLGMMEIGTSGKYFTNSTKFIVVDGTGTDTQKIEVYNGMAELLDGATQVEIAHDKADGTAAARTAGHGWLRAFLEETTLTLKEMIYFTESNFTYASTTGRNKQVDTIFIPKAALVYSGRTNLVYIGNAAADSQTTVDGANVYLYTVYNKDEAQQIWIDATGEGKITAANDSTDNDHFYEIEDSGRKMPDGTVIYTCTRKAETSKVAATGRPDPTDAAYLPIVDRTAYWAATYSAQTASVGDDPTGTYAGDYANFDVSNAKVVNLNVPTSPGTGGKTGYIWSTVTDLGSLNGASSAYDSYTSYLGTAQMPRVSMLVKADDPMVVEVIYVCFDQTTAL